MRVRGSADEGNARSSHPWLDLPDARLTASGPASGYPSLAPAYARLPSSALPRTLIALVVSCLFAFMPVARAAMDIKNNGPVLDAGRFTMRVTNVGVVG